jgi:Copper amine oxidase N-terminal domain./KWG Leptospira.
MRRYLVAFLSLLMILAIVQPVHAETDEDTKYLPYDYVGGLSEGLAFYCNWSFDGKCGFIDTTGKIVIEAKYTEVARFSEGLAAVSNEGKWGYIDKTGKEVVGLKYDAVALEFSEGMAQVMKEGRWGYIDRTGKEVIPLIYEDTNSFGEGLAHVKKDGKYGYIDKSGKEVIKPQYDMAYRFREGLAPVQVNGKWGYIDKTGKVVIPFTYDAAQNFSEGLAWVKVSEKWGAIDSTGKEVIKFQYDNAYNFQEGLSPVLVNERWGFVDKSGKEVISPQFLEVHTLFTEGLALVSKDDGEGYAMQGFIDKQGKEVTDFNYDFSATAFNNGKSVFSDGGQGSYYFSDNPLTTLKSAVPTSSRILVNGKEVSFQVYNINGNNYFKLRDIAMVLNGTEKSFEVGWDGKKNAISLESGKAYTAVGGELVVAEKPATAEAKLSTSSIYLDGKEVKLTAYLINGNNYFKLRDVAAVINFGVTWDGATNTISIDSSTGYVED